ncbi:hypothetical protein FRC09_001757 [Ceratobasidium sp. 395]|nr:hypothetical protein FRC09_001757 [Ceratobasidium sp. 395]
MATLKACSLNDNAQSNILISDAGEPLLSDFGNAILQERTLEFTDTTTKRSISLRWTAPELLSQCQYSPQADVYALGMTILEVVTGAIPYVGIKDISVITAIVSGRLPARPEHIPAASKDGNTLWMLLNHCWAFSPGSRPTASEVKEVVAKITPEGLTYCRENERKRYASSGNLEDGATTRKRVKPDRAMKVVQELLLTEGKHLKTLEHIQTDYCQAAPPDLVEHLQFMVEISRTFIEHLSSDLSVQGACDAFLVVEERLETAFVRWSISVSKAAAWIHGHHGVDYLPFTQEGNSLIDWLSAIVPSERAFRLVVSYQQIELNVPSTSVLRPLTERALQVAKRIAERCNEAERDADDPLT